MLLPHETARPTPPLRLVGELLMALVVGAALALAVLSSGCGIP